MIFKKRSRENGEETRISEALCRRKLTGHYEKVQLAVEAMVASPGKYVASTGFYDYALDLDQDPLK